MLTYCLLERRAGTFVSVYCGGWGDFFLGFPLKMVFFFPTRVADMLCFLVASSLNTVIIDFPSMLLFVC